MAATFYVKIGVIARGWSGLVWFWSGPWVAGRGQVPSTE
jgi:hypothetical protein